MLQRIFLIALLTTTPNLVSAAGLDISLGNESAQFVYLIDSGSLGFGGTDLGLGMLYNEDDDFLFHAGLMVVGNMTDRKDIALGMGAKLYAAELDDADDEASAVAIGGQFRYVLQSQTPIGFIAEVFFAPNITAFGETEDFRETNIRVELEIFPSTRGYIGYRNIETETEDSGEIEIDDSAHIGVRMVF